MHFTHSEPLTFGIELELQIVDPDTGRLSPAAQAIWPLLTAADHGQHFALEATLATIELNSSVHRSAPDMVEEVLKLTRLADEAARAVSHCVRGGGSHISQFWNERVMTPSPRAQELEARFGFLPKRFSTYGMHVHVGMPDAHSAIRVANVLQGVAPLLIALSAASPFLQLSETGFAAARPLEPLIYPHGGPMPLLADWAHLERVTGELFKTGIAHSLKDIYWDVRPKPEFGTVEVRVFDTPLSVHKAVAMAAFTRGLAHLALRGDLALPGDAEAGLTHQRVSRFLACKDGLNARLFNPFVGEWMPARDWLAQLTHAVEQAAPFASDLGHLAELRTWADSEQDHQKMQRLWHGFSSTGGATPAALKAYSDAVCAHLLQPVTA